MARGKVAVSDYHEFGKMLPQATDNGARIDKGDARWAEYVKTRGINQGAVTAIALQKFEGAVTLILAEGKDTDGLCFSSKNVEACMSLVTIQRYAYLICAPRAGRSRERSSNCP